MSKELSTAGVALERGYVADKDTSVYNPGLALLTESEKERLVEAVGDARKEVSKRESGTRTLNKHLQNWRANLTPFTFMNSEDSSDLCRTMVPFCFWEPLPSNNLLGVSFRWVMGWECWPFLGLSLQSLRLDHNRRRICY